MSGGGVSLTLRALCQRLNCSRGNILWKSVVQPNGTAIVLPMRSYGW